MGAMLTQMRLIRNTDAWILEIPNKGSIPSQFLSGLQREDMELRRGEETSQLF
jgi:hypothetical protein